MHISPYTFVVKNFSSSEVNCFYLSTSVEISAYSHPEFD